MLINVPAAYEPRKNGKNGFDSMEKLRWLFLSQLMNLTCVVEERRELAHFINISAKYLQRNYGHRYAEVIRSLDGNAVEINHRYSTGLENRSPFSKSYRLTDKYRNGKSRLLEITGKCFEKKLTHKKIVDYDNLSRLDQWLYDCLKRVCLIEQVYKDYEVHDPWMHLTLKQAKAKHHSYTVDPHGRRHTIWTRLSRECRPYVRIDGKQMVESDVSACQPLLLGKLADEHAKHGVKRPKRTSTFFTNHMSYVFSDANDFEKDVKKWIDLCYSGEFYNHFWERVKDAPRFKVFPNKKRLKPFYQQYAKMDEAKFKKSVLIPLFDEEWKLKWNPVFRIIEREFPTIANYVRHTKKKNYRDTATILQGLESKIMIEGAARRLSLSHPDEPIFTIHDSIASTAAHQDNVRQAMRDSFEEYGLDPYIK